MSPLRGWAQKGQRFLGRAPYGHWNTMTFLAALRYDRIDAPFLLDGPINKVSFIAYIEQVVAPTLRPGDLVVERDLLMCCDAPLPAPRRQLLDAWRRFAGRHGARLTECKRTSSLRTQTCTGAAEASAVEVVQGGRVSQTRFQKSFLSTRCKITAPTENAPAMVSQESASSETMPRKSRSAAQ